MTLIRSDSTDADFVDLIQQARRGVDNAWVVELTRDLVSSGETLSWEFDSSDVASTGGPASLSTLLTPLALVALGEKVVKLAVPGRPAGAIDALGTMPNYKVSLSRAEVAAAVSKSGFAHFLADGRFAPLDARLFDFRRRAGAVNVPALAAASLLSKKVAVGVLNVGLDVRVGSYGNFGTDLESARANAKMFCDIGIQLGLRTTAFLSGDADSIQPWIGRGEVLVALAKAIGLIDCDEGDQWLEAHSNRCIEMARLTVGTDRQVSKHALCSALELHLKEQGTTLAEFEERCVAIAHAPRVAINAKQSGTLSVNFNLVREILVDLQARSELDRLSPRFADPAGLLLASRPGTAVEKDAPLAFVRADVADLESTLVKLSGSFEVTEATSLTAPEGGQLEVVRGE